MVEKIKSQIEGKEGENKIVKKVVEETALTYSDLTKVDKVRKAQYEVQELEVELNYGIKKIMGNRETLTQMDDKAEEMKCKNILR